MDVNEYSRPGSDQSGLENLIDKMPLGILSCDREGNIIATSDFLLDILVSPSADATRKINMLTFPPLVESGISATVEKALVTGNNAFIETSYASKQGKELFLSFKVFPLKDENGIICACNVIVEDLTDKSIAREKTSLNEELYTSLVKQLDEAVFVTDIEGHIFEVNDHASEMLGYSKEELKEMTIHDLHIPERRENGLKSMKKLQMGGAVCEETKYATAKGDIIDVEVNTRLLKGQYRIVQAVVRDVTERKREEEIIRKSERKYRKLFENNKSAVVITKMIRDENGYPVDFVHLEVNAAYDKLSVLKSKDVIGKTASELLPGTDIHENPFICLHRDVALTGIPISVELYSEELKEYFSITAYQSEKDIIVGVSENITKRKEAEEKLIRSEYKYRSLFEKSNDIIIVHHVDGKIVDANKKAYEVLGYSEEELLQKNIMDIIVPEDHKIVIDDLKEISDLKDINDRNSPRKEVRAIKSDGAVLYVDVSVSVIKDRKNLVMAVARDITDRIKYEEAMLKAKIEAETASRAKSEFLTTMSHELRTPLNSIIGFSESMLDGIAGELEEKPQKYLQNISKSGTHLLEVINDILDISKIEAGKMQLYFETVNVNSFISDMITMIQPLAGNKELNLIADIPSDIPDISADKAKFKQIMSNLLGNAVKFTNNGGTISISCRSEDSKLVFSVTDTGIGISEADQNKLFKPFTQIDSSISRKYAGTGLGLALVKEIIELHHGRIWVESEPGKGSSFLFELPVEHADTLINRKYPEKSPPYL